MIRGNLSTRPFYNDTAVRTWFVVAGLVVLAATVFNIERFVQYSRSDADLAGRASRDEQRARDLRAESVKLRSSVDVANINATAAEAGSANALIARRTFSWTDLFGRFEDTLPPEVRLKALRQSVDSERGIVLSVALEARGVEAVSDFIEALLATSVFSDVLVTDERLDPETGTLDAVLHAVYHPDAAAAKGKAR